MDVKKKKEEKEDDEDNKEKRKDTSIVPEEAGSGGQGPMAHVRGQDALSQSNHPKRQERPQNAVQIHRHRSL